MVFAFGSAWSDMGFGPSMRRLAQRRGQACWASGAQEQGDVFHEQLRILVRRPVSGVGVEDELRVRDILLQDERVDREDDKVLVAVHDKRRLLDRLEVIVGALTPYAPLDDSLDLPLANLLVHLGIAIHPTEMLALQELQPCLSGTRPPTFSQTPRSTFLRS